MEDVLLFLKLFCLLPADAKLTPLLVRPVWKLLEDPILLLLIPLSFQELPESALKLRLL